MARVELREVTKTYGKVTALDSVSFDARNGELLAILGPPGAGKSTTLKIIAGIESVTDGQILLDGHDITGVDIMDRNVSMAFESYALYPHFTVEENLAFPLRSPKREKKYSSEEIKQEVLRTAKLLHIENLLNRKPRELSGGQRQRVSLGRSIIRTPNLFLLDEPIAHLDAKLRHILRRELHNWQQERGVTTLYTTTDYLEAFTVGDRIVVLNEGRIEQVGTWDEIYHMPKSVMVGKMVSDPAINLFEGLLISGRGGLAVSVGDITIPLPKELVARIDESYFQQKIKVGIFPSKIQVLQDGSKNPDGSVVNAMIKLIEVRGSRKILGLETQGGVRFTSQISLEAELREGESIRCVFGASDIHLFDTLSSQNIRLVRSS